MKAIIIRDKKQLKPDHQTLGKFYLYDDDNNEVFKCETLELPWKNNEISESCVPVGDYSVKPRTSQKFKNHYILENTTPRELILIHFGNYHTDIRGCILVGKKRTDLNGDGCLDITNSRATLEEILKLAPKGFELTIE